MRILLGIFLVLGTYFGLSFLFHQQVPTWKTEVGNIVDAMEDLSLGKVRYLQKESNEKLPSVYPFSSFHRILEEMENLFLVLEKSKDLSFPFEEKRVEISSVWEAFDLLKSVESSLQVMEKKVRSLPSFLLTEAQMEQREKTLEQLVFAENLVGDVLKFEKIIEQFADKKERVLILLQNQNEPRSTGGFVGSFVLLDFKSDAIEWEFSDVYAFDRQVPEKSQLDAPPFFHNLSQTISLRDANFWPDFPTSAQKYQYFFDSMQTKTPNTVVAVNLNFVSALLKTLGPINMQKWNLELNDQNFDLGLQFLVESKIAGRFAVKKPVEIFMHLLFSRLFSGDLEVQKLSSLDWHMLVKHRNILAFSSQKSLQKLFEKWGIDGQLRRKSGTDNFLYLDFVSVGANKSEKFMWTKFWHDSEIHKDGRVRNALSIKRTHALKPGEIKDLLGWNRLPQNVQELMSEDLLWKLGAGENRTVLRLYVPKDARLVFHENLSGRIKESFDETKQFKIFEVPMNVLPRESLETKIVYETRIDRGSQNWRPYFLQVGGTPGKTQTTFLSTISTEKNGAFSAETKNIGLPNALQDLEFRAVVEF